MNINFIMNDYLNVWNLLFRSSISDQVQALKQRLWMNYRKQYGKIEKDNLMILKDERNFIPDDDTLYNLFFEWEGFKTIKKETEKYRLYLMNTWDKNKKQLREMAEEILRIKFREEYNLLVVHPSLDIVEYVQRKDMNSIVWGRKKDFDKELIATTDLVFYLSKCEVGSFQRDYKEIVAAILELAIKNELRTRLQTDTAYLIGDNKINFLKRQIYPYWLMYLGADKEMMLNYMLRDKIVFDIEKYPVNNELKKMDIYGFIDYCVKNHSQILNMDLAEDY